MGKGGPRCHSRWTHSCLFAKGALAVYPCWLVAPCPCPPSPYTYHQLHTRSFFVSRASPTPCNPFNSLSLTLASNVFTQWENKLPYSNARRSNLLQWEGIRDEEERGGRTHSSWHAIVNLAALEMFTWTSSVILSLGVAFSLSFTAEWSLCAGEFSAWCTFLAPRLVFHANASSYPGTRGMALTWAPESPCDDHHPCTYLS